MKQEIMISNLSSNIPHNHIHHYPYRLYPQYIHNNLLSNSKIHPPYSIYTIYMKKMKHLYMIYNLDDIAISQNPQYKNNHILYILSLKHNNLIYMLSINWMNKFNTNKDIPNKMVKLTLTA